MAKPGAELKLVTDNDVLTSIDLLEAFCDGWNQKRYRFGALQTCQFFAEKLCEFLGLSLKDWSIGSLIVSGVSVVAVGIVAFIAFAFGRRSANSDRRWCFEKHENMKTWKQNFSFFFFLLYKNPLLLTISHPIYVSIFDILTKSSPKFILFYFRIFIQNDKNKYKFKNRFAIKVCEDILRYI